MLRITKKGQSTAEYAIVIGLVIAAAVAMQVYVKRGLQGKIKDATNLSLGSNFTTNRYEPYYASQNLTSTKDASMTSATATGGGVTRTIGGSGEVTSRTGNQTTGAAQNN